MGRSKAATASNARGLRLAGEGEQYARVKAMHGDGRFTATAADGSALACRIPGKFRGRHRGGNMVLVGELVLVGVRAWEARGAEVPRAELLEAYSRDEAARLEARGVGLAPRAQDADFCFSEEAAGAAEVAVADI